MIDAITILVHQETLENAEENIIWESDNAPTQARIDTQEEYQGPADYSTEATSECKTVLPKGTGTHPVCITPMP